jgi:hypothetical protein
MAKRQKPERAGLSCRKVTWCRENSSAGQEKNYVTARGRAVRFIDVPQVIVFVLPVAALENYLPWSPGRQADRATQLSAPFSPHREHWDSSPGL